MKSMGTDAVVRFPFPTAPDRGGTGEGRGYPDLPRRLECFGRHREPYCIRRADYESGTVNVTLPRCSALFEDACNGTTRGV